MSKVILITGTSSGFGKSIAEKLHSIGHIVIGTSRNADSVKSDFKTMKLDINNYEMSKNLISKIVETHGKIDILINNAGINITGPLESANMLFSNFTYFNFTFISWIVYTIPSRYITFNVFNIKHIES